MPDTSSLALQVEQAFAQARAGNFEPSSQLHRLGPAALPLLQPYLNDPDEDIRGQVIALLGLIKGTDALPLLASALADASPELQQRTARILYQGYEPDALASNTTLVRALKESVRKGNLAGAALLLLGHFPGPDTQQVLSTIGDSAGDAVTEVFDWTPVVPVGFVVDVARSRLGDQHARNALLRRIENGDVNELSFLLYSLRDVDSPEVLHALKAATFDDQREIAGELPSEMQPQIRVQDLAVTRFAQRLGLPLTFEVSGAKRYAPSEIQQARDAVDALVPI